jgi:hypothetical protein
MVDLSQYLPGYTAVQLFMMFDRIMQSEDAGGFGETGESPKARIEEIGREIHTQAWMIVVMEQSDSLRFSYSLKRHAKN